MFKPHCRLPRLAARFCACTFAVLALAPAAPAPAQEPPSDAASGAATPDPGTWIDGRGDVDVAAVLAALDPDARAYLAHVTTLGNPFFEGRAPGTNGNRVAAQYIEFWFRYYRLEPAFPQYDADGKPAGDGSVWTSYRQPFDIDAPGEMEATRQELAFDDATGRRATYAAGSDFVAIGSGDGQASGPLTFVGYGIATGPDGQNHYGDADLTGRIAVMLRFEPSDSDGRSKWNGGNDGWSSHAALNTKMMEAASRGAAGIILINPPGTVDKRTYDLMSVNESAGLGVDVPVVQMSLPAADRLFNEIAGYGLSDAKKSADADAFTATNLDDQFKVTIAASIGRRHASTDNVGGVIRGRGELKDQWIIIGAHYDHVGYGYFGSRGGRNAAGAIHPGADDNASGTSAVLVLADRLTKAYADLPPDASARSILLMTFSAEESGLNGSRYYTRHATLTPAQVDIMLNLDMVGRLRRNSLEVSGVGSGKGLGEIIQPFFEKSGLHIVSQQTGGGPSDHASFNAVGIPVLFFFTGLHREYHSPADVASLINPVGAIRIVDLAQQIALEFARRPEKLEHQPTGGDFRLDMLDQPAQVEVPPAAPAMRVRVRLGIRPAYQAQGEGVHLEGVSEGTPAQKAGLRAGDVIETWNGSPLADIPALMGELAKHNPGDEITLGVRRDGQVIEIKVTLAPIE